MNEISVISNTLAERSLALVTVKVNIKLMCCSEAAIDSIKLAFLIVVMGFFFQSGKENKESANYPLRSL